ncbi:hypothetical protein N7G274_005143 [Stereocaulon virgatum]|uniref:Ada DNA repair metal-binding domain-containing protein n=1 Tax=Stereocaulon virgatum TaxID=373712 RepID=A0ABR4AA19_9LECA
MNSVLQQPYTSDETYSNLNLDAVYNAEPLGLRSDLAGSQKSAEIVSDVALRDGDLRTLASLPLTPDFHVDRQDSRFSDNKAVPTDERDFMLLFPTQGINDFDVDFQPDQAVVNHWDNALGFKPDDSFMFQSIQQPVNTFTNQSISTSTSSYSGEEAWSTSNYTFPAYANPLNDSQLPDLTDCSTPAYRKNPEDTSRVTKSSSNDFETDNQRWHASRIRSRAADSAFLYGVLTTKIYCRPSCASRRASRRNVTFFPFPGAIEAAEKANLRACKRCKPELPGTVNTGVLGICQVICIIITETQKTGDGETKETLKLDSLALLAGLSAFHFLRLFKATTQLTPGGFIHACRSIMLQDALGQDNASNSGKSVDASLLVKDSSCWSPRTARKALGGISPSEYAKGAPSTNVHHCCGETPCGRLCAVFSRDENAAENRVHAVLLGPDAETKASLRFPQSKEAIAYQGHLDQCLRDIHLEARDRDTELNAAVLPTLWRARVWLRLMQH